MHTHKIHANSIPDNESARGDLERRDTQPSRAEFVQGHTPTDGRPIHENVVDFRLRLASAVTVRTDTRTRVP
jgi:hypothetical protein